MLLVACIFNVFKFSNIHENEYKNRTVKEPMAGSNWIGPIYLYIVDLL